ncbi:hypothetical protein HID58_011143 [Brassica napus]|uniref:(rape) hypothetical protein n=1 Tax=Brassica napus TaxID=3708 RepID=A0A816W0R1_BRANA|nr:cytochrome P450 705A5-like [Brassica napus]KAH0934026.1 hypothetical protein HID58_011143 [Brassica napus]CAF2126886.1 unnamed protein product [Brassica napus]
MAAMMIVDFQNYFIFILLCLFSLLCYTLFFRKQKYSRLGFDLPPSPPSLPIIGHLHIILSLLIHKSLQKLASKHGPLLHLRIFSLPIVLVSSASVADEIFKAQDVNVSSRSSLPTSEGSLYFGSFGFVTAPHGDYWKFMKKLITTKLLGSQALERSRGIRADEAKLFYSNLLDKAMKDERVNIREEAMKLTNNSMCKMLTGRICLEDAERVRGLVARTDSLSKKLLLASVLRRPLEKLGISLFKKELMCVSSRFDEVLERYLVEHEKKQEEQAEAMLHGVKIRHSEQGVDVMDVLIEAYRDENAEYKITRNHIKSLLVDLFIAGSETTSNIIEWTMAELINNPKSLEKLRGEIDLIVGKTRLIQETDLPNLPYLQAVMKEGLRLHPPVPLVVRTFQEECEVKGFHIPEKTTLVVNGYAVMRDPDVWEDPDEFKPERFLVSSTSGQQEDKIREKVPKYIPFGSGRRGCPGSNLAYLFLGIAVGVMVQCFDWRIKEEKVNMDEAAGAVSLRRAHPVHATPVARNRDLLT